MDFEIGLIQRVRRFAGPYLANLTSSVPTAFFAALTANESGVWLQTNASVPPRFEPGAYQHLKDILLSGIPCGSITKAVLLDKTDEELRQLASSWGFTQVMGYNVLGWKEKVQNLDKPDTHYALADRQLQWFIRRFKLDPAKDFGQMFRAWNTGNISSLTFDKSYIDNGLRRMDLWLQL